MSHSTHVSQSVPLPTAVAALLKPAPLRLQSLMPSPWLPMLTLPLVLPPITSPPGSSLPPRRVPFVPSTPMSRTFKPQAQRSLAQIPTEIALTEVPCSTPFPAPTSLFLAQTMDSGASLSTQLLALISIMTVPEVSCTR